MGANTSSLLSEEVEEIAEESSLSPKEVKRLYKRFQKLDRNRSGTLEPEELAMIPELAMNPLVPRITALFDHVNFRQFVNNLAVFGPTGSPEDKISFAFRIYDVDGDGFITKDDLSTVLRLMVGDNLDRAMLDEVTTTLMRESDSDGDGRISRSDFEQAASLEDIVSRMTITL